jgi:hypothetical protein
MRTIQVSFPAGSTVRGSTRESRPHAPTGPRGCSAKTLSGETPVMSTRKVVSAVARISCGAATRMVVVSRVEPTRVPSVSRTDRSAPHRSVAGLTVACPNAAPPPHPVAKPISAKTSVLTIPPTTQLSTRSRQKGQGTVPATRATAGWTQSAPSAPCVRDGGLDVLRRVA